MQLKIAAQSDLIGKLKSEKQSISANVNQLATRLMEIESLMLNEEQTKITNKVEPLH